MIKILKGNIWISALLVFCPIGAMAEVKTQLSSSPRHPRILCNYQARIDSPHFRTWLFFQMCDGRRRVLIGRHARTMQGVLGLGPVAVFGLNFLAIIPLAWYV